MPVVNELQPPIMATAKSNSNGHVAENNGLEPGVITEDSDEGSHKSGEDEHTQDVRQQRLHKALLVSEEWKSAMAKPRAANFGKRENERFRPSLTFGKFKQECVFALSTELSMASDSKVCSVIKNMLFLLHEANLIKDQLLFKCKRMREDFEREEAAVREILAEANIPTAISDSLLDSHFTMSSTRTAGPGQEPPPILSPNNHEATVDSAAPTVIPPPPFPPTNVPPPPVNTSAPPPGLPVFPVHGSASLPDLTLPPPPINNVTNISQMTPPPPLPPPLPSSSSSSGMFSVPPPQIPISSGIEPVAGGQSNSYTPTLPPPTILPPPSAVPPPASLPPPPALPPPSALPPPPAVSEFPCQPNAMKTETTVETILNASLRPCSTLQFSGPFGPPIAPPPRSDYPPPPTQRSSSFQGPRRFDTPNRGGFNRRRFEGPDRRPSYRESEWHGNEPPPDYGHRPRIFTPQPPPIYP